MDTDETRLWIPESFSGTHPFRPQCLIDRVTAQHVEDGYDADDAAQYAIGDAQLFTHAIDEGRCPRCGEPLQLKYPSGSRVTACRCIPVCWQCGAHEATDLYYEHVLDWPYSSDAVSRGRSVGVEEHAHASGHEVDDPYRRRRRGDAHNLSAASGRLGRVRVRRQRRFVRASEVTGMTDRDMLTYTDEDGKPADETRATRMILTSGGVVRHDSGYLDDDGNPAPQSVATRLRTTIYDDDGTVAEVRDKGDE